MLISSFVQAVSYFIVSFAMYLVAQISPLEWKKASVCNHHDEHVEVNDDDGENNDGGGGVGNDGDDDNEFFHSSNSLCCEEVAEEDDDDFMTNRETSIATMRMDENTSTMELLENENSVDGGGGGEEEDGNCCENYSSSTFQQQQQYFKNLCVMSEENDLERTWINMISSRNFLVREPSEDRTCNCQQQQQQIGPSIYSNKCFDLDDDGLIGYAEGDLKQDDEEFLRRREAGESDEVEFSSVDNESSNNIELISYINNFSLKNSFAWTLGTLLQSTSDLYPKVLVHFF